MKKLIFMGILGLFALGACNNKNTQGHEGHGHSTVTHNNDEHDHEAEGHDHEAEGHTHGTEGHTHGTEGECNGDHKHDAADNHQALLPDTMKLPKPPTATKSSSRKRKPMLPE